jgi:hypothetical protein
MFIYVQMIHVMLFGKLMSMLRLTIIYYKNLFFLFKKIEIKI